VVDGKPQFVHRTFAEYFTARWFSRNFEHNRSALEHIFLAGTFRVMTAMFDRMLTEGCPLHCATLSEECETVFEENNDFQAVDKGGRTVTHLIARHEFILYLNYDKQSDPSYKASLQKTDCIALGTIAIRYKFAELVHCWRVPSKPL